MTQRHDPRRASTKKESLSPREALLDQLVYLADEARALQSLIRLVPPAVLEDHPLPDEPSVKEYYALLLRTDELVNIPFVRQLVAGDTATVPRLAREELLRTESWNDTPIESILSRLTEARLKLVELCRSANNETWGDSTPTAESGLFNFLYEAVQGDVNILRALGERLHDARLGSSVTESSS